MSSAATPQLGSVPSRQKLRGSRRRDRKTPTTISYAPPITSSFTTLWIRADDVDDAISKVIRSEATTAAAIGDNGWTIVALDNDKRLTTAVAAAIAALAQAETLRVRLSRSRRLRIEQFDKRGTLITEARWPEREGGSPLLAVERWPRAAIAEPILEHLADTLGISTTLATVPPRGWSGIGLEARTIDAAPIEGLLPVDDARAPVVAQLRSPGPTAALLVLAPEVEQISLPDLIGVTFRAWSVPPRWGSSGRAQISCRTDPGADPSASEALARWISGLEGEISQAVIHKSAWDPLLQIDFTPWEILWGRPPIHDRTLDWPEHEIRGAGDAIAVSEPLAGILGDPPDGSRREGILIHRADVDWRRWHTWAHKPGG